MTRTLVALAAGLALAAAAWPSTASAQRPNPGWERGEDGMSGSYPWIDETSHPPGYSPYGYGYYRDPGLAFRGPGFSFGFRAGPGYYDHGYGRYHHRAWRHRHWR